MFVIAPDEINRAVTMVDFGSVIAEFNMDHDFLEFIPHKPNKIQTQRNTRGSVADGMFQAEMASGSKLKRR